MSIQWPDHLHAKSKTLLAELGYSFDKPGAVASAVKKLSDFYIANPTAPTPWNEKWAQAAYLAYYLPLNYSRVRRAVTKASQIGFFDGLTTLIDFGSGLGSAQLAIEQEKSDWGKRICFDVDATPMSLHRALTPSKIEFWKDFDEAKLPDASTRLAVLSYVYTELPTLPKWAAESEALLIIEPSTRDDGRRLQTLRGELLGAGFTAFAPCAHQAACPLSVDSEKDWCHDRVEWKATPEWEALEALLPMRNRTLTLSYLAVRKTKHPEFPQGPLGRMIGDKLEEKGKTRQLICRGPQREFLAWFPNRLKADLELKRGDLVRLGELEPKANELRVKQILSVETITFPKTEL